MAALLWDKISSHEGGALAVDSGAESEATAEGEAARTGRGLQRHKPLAK